MFADCTNNGLSAIGCTLFFAIMGNCIKDKNHPVSKGKALGMETFFSPTLGNCHSSSPYQGRVALGMAPVLSPSRQKGEGRGCGLMNCRLRANSPSCEKCGLILFQEIGHQPEPYRIISCCFAKSHLS